MTKVELAEGKLLNEIHEHKSLGIAMALDELVAAAHEEGENELQAAFDLLWKRMGAWEAEWRAEHPKERGLTSPDAIQLIEWKIAKAHAEGVAEGAEKEGERIYAYASDANCPYYRYDFTDDGYYLRASNLREFIKSGKEWVNPKHPASVLASSEQEKITRLAEIVAEISAAEEPQYGTITRGGFSLPPKGGDKMTINEARLALCYAVSEALPDHAACPLAVIYAMDDLEKTVREEALAVLAPTKEKPYYAVGDKGESGESHA
jgi:hypothetical protein